jgi:hypothetical protein
VTPILTAFPPRLVGAEFLSQNPAVPCIGVAVAQVVLAAQLARWLPSGAGERETTWQCTGHSVREVLETLFVQHPTLRGYVLDERGKIRRHVAIFVDGSALSHHSDLSEPLGERAEVHVLQALSGG